MSQFEKFENEFLKLVLNHVDLGENSCLFLKKTSNVGSNLKCGGVRKKWLGHKFPAHKYNGPDPAHVDLVEFER